MLSYQRPIFWDVLNNGKPYEPLEWQARHFHAQESCKRIIAACGRRSGKSSAMLAEIVKEATKGTETVLGVEHAPLIYVVGPTTETSMKVWAPVWAAFVPAENSSYIPPLGFLHAEHDKNRRYIKLHNGTQIFGKTADDPRGLQGDRVTLVVFDEAHEAQDEAWANLMPSLLDSGGKLIAIGIPKGKNRFRSYWELGQGSDPNFYSFSVPSTENPVMDIRAREAGYDDTWEWLRATAEGDLTDAEFRQQYHAEWIEEDGQVFRDLSKVFNAPWYRPHLKHENAMGLDIGKLHDYTVAYVGDLKTSTFLHGDRFNGLDYTAAVPRIAKIYRSFACRFIHMDVTGVGEAVADMLRKEGCNIVPFKFTNESKSGLISTFVREVERGNVRLPMEDKILHREMEMFEAEVSGTTVKYNAPKGYFDDCVIAAGLLVAKMAQRRGYAKSPVRKPYVSFGTPNRIGAVA